MASRAWEERVRAATFEAIRAAQAIHGEVLPFEVIQRGAVVADERIPIFSLQQGIHKPRQLDAALAVTTTPPKRLGDAPYDDRFGDDGLFGYHYRDASASTDRARRAASHDNEAVRRALREQLPIVYWFGVTPGNYLPFFPVQVVRDDPDGRVFGLDLTEFMIRDVDVAAGETPARAYRGALVRTRMHQARFREAVLRAYQRSCAICRLRRRELVDAAHIVGDSEGGEPVVPNGLALCKLHHAAFDRHILGVRPDLRVVVRRDILAEVDGPMLVHGLQGFHDAGLGLLPHRRQDRPSTDFLERRWEQFRSAS